VLGIISARTVNLTHIATERPGRAKVASTYRRLQRFFQQVRLAMDTAMNEIGPLELRKSDTVYMTVVDKDLNAVSFHQFNL
jgi:gamma-glutamyltranspeptidase